MARASGNDKLVCKHDGTGGWQMVDFELIRLGRGYGIIAPCLLGDHYLAFDKATGRFSVGLEEHAWPSAVKAIEAREAWRKQQQGG